MFWCSRSKRATLSLNCFWAASELPGRSAATLIVTFAWEAAVASDAATAAVRAAATSATSVIALNMDFIVLPFRGARAPRREHRTLDKSMQELSYFLHDSNGGLKRAQARRSQAALSGASDAPSSGALA